jgi:hypothetical protein
MIHDPGIQDPGIQDPGIQVALMARPKYLADLFKSIIHASSSFEKSMLKIREMKRFPHRTPHPHPFVAATYVIC